MPSIFTRIISGELPSIKVHEDEFSLVIMDINPIQNGQLLAFPKREVSTVWDLPAQDYRALMDTVQKAGQRLKAMFPDKKIGVMIEGMEVTDHAHVKIFPFSNAAEYHASPDSNEPPERAELEKLASKLAF